jgi:hypothetical protein
VKNAATAAAIFLALLSLCSNKTKAPAVQRSNSLTTTPSAPRSPAPAIIPSAPSPLPPPVAASTLHFSGEANRGQRFEKVIAPKMVFRLEPYAENDSGWDIRIIPGIGPSAESIDCIGAISTPTHGVNDLSIDLSDENTTEETLQSNPHEFDFVPNSPNCKRAWDLNNSINYRYKLTDQERQDLNDRIGAIPYGHGELMILDSRVDPPIEKSKLGVIDRIAFEVDLQFPQAVNPGPAKAEANKGPAADLWPEAEREILYSPPSSLAQLPPKIRSELQSRGCRIPQTYAGSGSQNVMRGQFARQRQTDWAVLCSKQSISSILIFWNGSETAPAEIDPAPDRNLLTSLANGKIGYSRKISVVGKKFIMMRYRAYGGPKPPPIDHDGIEDEFLEKGSAVHYFYRGQWLRLTGSD